MTIIQRVAHRFLIAQGLATLQIAHAASNDPDADWLVVAYLPGTLACKDTRYNAMLLQGTSLHGKVDPQSVVGTAVVAKDHPGVPAHVVAVFTEPAYRRQGIATKLYQYAEHTLHLALHPSTGQTADGKALWKAYNKTASLSPKEMLCPGSKRLLGK